METVRHKIVLLKLFCFHFCFSFTSLFHLLPACIESTNTCLDRQPEEKHR